MSAPEGSELLEALSIPTVSTTSEVVVFFSSVRWNFLWQRHHALAAAAAYSGSSVIFVEPHPRGLKHILAHLLKRKQQGSRLENPLVENVHVLPWSPLFVIPSIALSRIKGIAAGPVIHSLIFLPSRSSIKLSKALNPSHTVYDKVVDWAAVPTDWFPPRRWRANEHHLEDLSRLGRCALTTDSLAVKNDWRTANVDSKVIFPAADPEFSSNLWGEPPLTGPLGYFGTIREEEVDVPYLVALARHNDVEIIGDVPTTIAQSLTEAGATVHPAQTLEALTQSMRRWRAILLPYKTGPRTRTLVPAKTWNTLAAGRPVFVMGLELPTELREQMNTLPDVPAPIDHRGAVISSKVSPKWSDRWNELSAWSERNG